MTSIQNLSIKIFNIRRKVQQLLTMERILVLSFAVFILSGTFMLMLPQATNGSPLKFIDVLFTATSATCVTGLVVVDTGIKFTLLGQLIILTMIQLGALGIMTFSTAFLYVLEGRLSLGSRDLLYETLSQGPMPNIKRLLKTVFFATMAIEGIGSIILTLRFLSEMPPTKAIYYGVFHAISAFCNAGFSLYSDSLMLYKNDLIVNFTITSLIILGGLGFIVIYELPRLRKFHLHDLSFHSRLVLVMTIILIFTGALLFFALESKNSIENMPWQTKILTSLFQSVTTRTAGFNTIDISLLSNPSLFIIIIFMFIGASPASCGGGIKITTFAILFALIRARFRNQDDVNLFYRRIPSESVSKAISITFFSAVVVLLCTMLLLITELAGLSHYESRGLSIELLFEVTSAFATVGLSAGATPDLSSAGRILITLMMFIGRLGPLTIAMTVGRKQKTHYKYAQEKILVG
ncbi:MAG: TrkH family potassium uptake protein [Campylobacterota bacterium]|nr:TrkH family potassium uptake protein [Campylobacterota bacterium]